MNQFKGTYTALVTPFTMDGSAVDQRRLAEQVRFQAEAGVTGVVACGTTGESPTLSDSEQKAVIEQVVEESRSHGIHAVAGTGSNDTRHAVAAHAHAASVGAIASLQVTPYYNKPSAEGLYRHFMTIADSVDLPIILYHVPGRCGVRMEMSLLTRLFTHPNIIAIKEASGSIDMVSSLVDQTDAVVLSGDDTLMLAMGSVGATGVISVVSNIAPDRVQRIWDCVEAGDLHGAREAHRWLFPLADSLMTLDVNPVTVKTAMSILSMDSGTLRSPLVGMAEQARQALVGILKGRGLLESGTVAEAINS